MPISTETAPTHPKRHRRLLLVAAGSVLLLVAAVVVPLFRPVRLELGSYGFLLSARPPESGALPASGWHFSRFPGETNIWFVVRTDRDGYHGIQYTLSWWHRP